jgi:hypothetical protein
MTIEQKLAQALITNAKVEVVKETKILFLEENEMFCHKLSLF